MTAHVHATHVEGCFRCELSADEALTAAGWERDDLERGVRRLQKLLADRGVTSCEDLCLEVCAGPCEGFDIGPQDRP